MSTITIRIGQVVPWPSAPMGFAQVSDLRRKKVEICYPFKNGRIARPIVRVAELAMLMHREQVQQPFPFHNPFHRALRPKSKAYEV